MSATSEFTIPDFDDLFRIREEIYKLSLEKARLSLEIQADESKIVLEVTSNPLFFQGGKPPSMAFVERTYMVSGVNEELLEKKIRLVEVSAELEYKRLTLELLRSKIDVWRTLSANERLAAGF